MNIGQIKGLSKSNCNVETAVYILILGYNSAPHQQAVRIMSILVYCIFGRRSAVVKKYISICNDAINPILGSTSLRRVEGE